MFCANCGKEVEGNFCSNCGAPVSPVNSVTEVDAPKSYLADKTFGPVKIDTANRMFQINGRVLQHENKGNPLVKGVLAMSTLGASLLVGKALSGKKIGSKNWYKFDDLVSYELIEDDATITKGGLGMALIGGFAFGGVGAIVGGITGRKVQKKRVESLFIRVTLNNFDSPLIIIPIIAKPVKTNSKEYTVAFKQAYEILSIFDVITHNS